MSSSIYDQIVVTGTVISADEKGIARGISPELPFPPSYVEFVRRFGYGLTCDLFHIWPPLGDYPDSFHQQSAGIKGALLATLRPNDPKYDFLLEPDGSYELVAGLVGFGTGDSGESLFWDIHNGRRDGEYPVYLTGSGIGIRYGGTSLEDFITRATSSGKFKHVLPFDSEPLPLTFKASSGVHLQEWRRTHG